MKVLFLDIDGVLNSRRYDMERPFENTVNIDETRMPLLKEIIDKTQAVIILSSSWRNKLDGNCIPLNKDGEAVVEMFSKYGIAIYGKTPNISPQKRADEINRWLTEHDSKVDSFVILDDMLGGWGRLTPMLVRTSYTIGRGLEQRHVDAAVKILNCDIKL